MVACLHVMMTMKIDAFIVWQPTTIKVHMTYFLNVFFFPYFELKAQWNNSVNII